MNNNTNRCMNGKCCRISYTMVCLNKFNSEFTCVYVLTIFNYFSFNYIFDLMFFKLSFYNSHCKFCCIQWCTDFF